ncbi:hypothetical protein [Halomontanus rarus]|uniref:hypothetical protein n=1 Tax=Halomontanus rarus TaxID=3034020 RepID=UPI0023E87D3F|nr:hypothetical protein [Halovivax sp. TS33]
MVRLPSRHRSELSGEIWREIGTKEHGPTGERARRRYSTEAADGAANGLEYDGE